MITIRITAGSILAIQLCRCRLHMAITTITATLIMAAIITAVATTAGIMAEVIMAEETIPEAATTVEDLKVVAITAGVLKEADIMAEDLREAACTWQQVRWVVAHGAALLADTIGNRSVREPERDRGFNSLSERCANHREVSECHKLTLNGSFQ